MRSLWFIRSTIVSLFIVALGVCVRPASAQNVTGAAVRESTELEKLRLELERLRTELEVIRGQYEQRLQALEDRLKTAEPGTSETAKQQPPPPAQVPPPTPPPVDQPPPQTLPAGSSKVFNPDMSVNGNFVGVAGKNALSDQPSLQLTEVEASFQAIVDPYARADFFLAAGPEGLEVEEGFITFTSLPKNLLLKVGKMRAQFGKVNTAHTHMMPTVDRPLVTGNLVGGDEGLSDAGLSLAYLVHNPVVFLEATGEVYRADSEVFQTSERSRLAYVGRLRAFKDITEDSNIDIGTSFAFGPTNAAFDLFPDVVDTPLPVLNKRLFGIDATFRYRPLRRAIYQRLNLRTELIWSRQELPDDLQATSFGFYGLGEYQFARRWYVGARVDRSARQFDSSLKDSGASAFMTFWPTEFSQVRGQFRRTNFAEGISGNEFLFQFNFSIGAHAAHIF